MYKGREGQWAFFLHRFSGLAILLYLLMHVFSISALAIGQGFYNRIHEVYKSPVFTVGLVFVAAGVLYHALNGVRIIFMDFFGWGVRYQRELWYATLFISGVGFVLTLWLNVQRILGEM
ncbi:MAG: succinate dehydrogenase, cytochrome b556 subunit [Deinococcaceae bacterium]